MSDSFNNDIDQGEEASNNVDKTCTCNFIGDPSSAMFLSIAEHYVHNSVSTTFNQSVLTFAFRIVDSNSNIADLVVEM